MNVKYVSRRKSASVKDIDIDIADVWFTNIDVVSISEKVIWTHLYFHRSTHRGNKKYGTEKGVVITEICGSNCIYGKWAWSTVVSLAW